MFFVARRYSLRLHSNAAMVLSTSSTNVYLGVDSDDMKTMCIFLNAVNAHMFREGDSLFEPLMGGPLTIIANCDNRGIVGFSGFRTEAPPENVLAV
jgi:hypothetical protein